MMRLITAPAAESPAGIQIHDSDVALSKAEFKSHVHLNKKRNLDRRPECQLIRQRIISEHDVMFREAAMRRIDGIFICPYMFCLRKCLVGITKVHDGVIGIVVGYWLPS